MLITENNTWSIPSKKYGEYTTRELYLSYKTDTSATFLVKMGCIGMNFPLVMTFNSERYKFKCQEIMDYDEGMQFSGKVTYEKE